MNSENKKLKEMLSHVTGNYTALQLQLVALMQKNHHTENEVNILFFFMFMTCQFSSTIKFDFVNSKYGIQILYEKIVQLS